MLYYRTKSLKAITCASSPTHMHLTCLNSYALPPSVLLRALALRNGPSGGPVVLVLLLYLIIVLNPHNKGRWCVDAPYYV